MVTALGVGVDADGNGVDPLTHRQIIKRHWNNTGIIGGLTVSGRSDLYYAVSAGVAVCSMGDADGYVEAYWPGGVTENAVSAGDGTYSRIDSIYLLANTGTPDNQVHCLVVQGTPSASPVAPMLPTGATLLMQMLVPAGASTTASASVNTSVVQAIPASAPLGLIGSRILNAKRALSTASSNPWEKIVGFTLPYTPTDRLYELEWSAIGVVAHSTSTATFGRGGYWVRFQLDGSALDENAEIVTTAKYERKGYRWPVVVSGGMAHTVEVDVKCDLQSDVEKPVTLSGNYWLKVWDRGIAR